jgi:hypothetical protein
MMGLAPSETKRMTVWELRAVTERWIEAHATDDKGHRLSETEKDEIWEWMQTRPAMPLTHRKNGKAHG